MPFTSQCVFTSQLSLFLHPWSVAGNPFHITSLDSVGHIVKRTILPGHDCKIVTDRCYWLFHIVRSFSIGFENTRCKVSSNTLISSSENTFNKPHSFLAIFYYTYCLICAQFGKRNKDLSSVRLIRNMPFIQTYLLMMFLLILFLWQFNNRNTILLT